jgi:hypothetical protein
VRYEIRRTIALDETAAIVLLHQRLAFAAAGARQEIECRPTLVAERGAEGWRIRLFQNTQIVARGSAGSGAAIASEHPHR